MKAKNLLDSEKFYTSSIVNNIVFIIGHIPLVLIYQLFKPKNFSGLYLGFDKFIVVEIAYIFAFLVWVFYMQRKIKSFGRRLAHSFLSSLIVYIILFPFVIDAIKYPEESGALIFGGGIGAVTIILSYFIKTK